jgi:beta-glucosidase
MPDAPKPRHEHNPLIFPEGFLWGAGNSAFQVEGGLTYSDWWEWEQTALPETHRSTISADQYNRWKEDFTLIKQLGHNTTRLGVEWSRIEPREGEFDFSEIEHYKEELRFLKEQGFTVMVTLHHFTNPAWFAKKGGWENSKAPHYFEKFVREIVPHIREYVDLWITINEPGTYVDFAFNQLEFPPQKKSLWSYMKVYWLMAQAHKKAYKAIHQMVPNAKVGYANSVQSYTKIHLHSIREAIAEYFAELATNHSFYILTGMKTHDFLGLNYYTNHYITTKKGRFAPMFVDAVEGRKDASDLGWEIHPEGMFDVLMDLAEYEKPIYITENGIASTNDDRRCRFLISYLKEIYHAIHSGADIRGYYYWSCIDNMELHRGYDPRFGLIEVDFTTQKRTPRPSAYVYADIIKHNAISHDLLKFIGHSIKAEDVLKSHKD